MLLSGELRPHVKIRLGARNGVMLLDTATTISVVDAQTFRLKPESATTLAGSSFPTLQSHTFRVWNQRADDPYTPGGRAMGLIGTDILASRTVTFHFDAVPRIAVGSERCDPRRLEAAGFAAIEQRGNYPADPRLAPPQPGIPVVYLRIGPVTAVAKVDTGLGEPRTLPRGIIGINDALLRQLRNAGVMLTEAGTFSRLDCRGNRVAEPLWRVDGLPLAIVDHDGRALFEYGPPLLRVLAPVSAQCGGGLTAIATPLALIGPAYLLRWGTTIFDGPNGLVWLARQRGDAFPDVPYRALALAWNAGSGHFAVASSERSDEAEAIRKALRECNKRAMPCRIALSRKGTAFSCLAVARSERAAQNLSWAVERQFAVARETALANCTRAHGPCRLEHASCNE